MSPTMPNAAPTHVVVVTPVLDDWTSFARLLTELDEVGRANSLHVRVLAIDDGSSQPPPQTSGLPPDRAVKEVQIIRLVRNLGHQRAIAVGLVEAYRQIDKSENTAVVVMDCDGEDPPADIPALLAQLAIAPQGVAVASRRRRYDPLPFKIGYAIYKRMYTMLCGRMVDFGNFCAISPAVLEQLVHTPEIWNHLAASVSKLRCPIVRVPHNRGRRYDGQSKMTIQSLVLHGMSALSVYTDIILIRIIFATLALAGMAGFAILVIIALYFLSNWTIRGWTSILAGVMFAILVQVLAASLAASFLLLSNRSTIGRIPVHELPIFVRDRHVLP
jgi:glycosyltransferase involved in cell wall biosynthesis